MAAIKRKVVVIGASENRERYAYMATVRLLEHNHEVFPIGIQEGKIQDVKIMVGKPMIENVDTVTLYINPRIQKEYYDYILKLRPKRIIFNPGAENEEFEKMAADKGIEPIEACTLVMLSTKAF